MLTETTSSTLQIRLLGEFLLSSDGRPIVGFNADRPQSLLAYLLIHRHAPQSRQYLAFRLWPDSTEGQARTNLRNLLYTVRHCFHDADSFLVTDTVTIQWRTDVAYDLDVEQFEVALQKAEKSNEAYIIRDCLETAVSFYQGDLLPGNYDDWLIPIREDLYQRYLGALNKLVTILEKQGEYDSAVRYCQRLVQLDPLDEVAAVHLMHLHALRGDRAAIRRSYQNLASTLQSELDIAPASATQESYRQLLSMETKQLFNHMAVELPGGQPRPLPIPPTPFIGREAELAEVAQLLANSSCRLLTILGAGGMGKSRLALQTAVGHQRIFADGIAYVSLAPLNSSDLIVPTLAEALNFTLKSSIDLIWQLLNFLRQKEILLVLDNFEHLMDGVSLLGDILAQVSGVKLLVTSRQRLDLLGEWVYEIGGLPLPEVDNTVLAENSAFALFWQSARRADSRFTISDDEACDILRICRLVGGMPLAIELAASWVRLLSCAEIAGEIERGLDFLAVPLRNIPERHRSIQAVFDYSWNLLTPPEQQALARLSVFRGDFTRDGAQQVAKTNLPMLSALVDKSLVRRHKTGHYDLHELIRQYTYEQLIKSKEFDNSYDRHFKFLEVAEMCKIESI